MGVNQEGDTGLYYNFVSIVVFVVRMYVVSLVTNLLPFYAENGSI